MFVCLLKLRHRDWVHVVQNQSQAVLGQTLHRAIIINTGNLVGDGDWSGQVMWHLLGGEQGNERLRLYRRVQVDDICNK